MVSLDTPKLDSDYITYYLPKGGSEIKGLLSKSKDFKVKLGGMIVVHENRGLNHYIEDTARIAALEDYNTLSPDVLTPLGGCPENDDEGRRMQRKRDRNEMLEGFIATFEYLKSH